jgi:hypothetical protein
VNAKQTKTVALCRLALRMERLAIEAKSIRREIHGAALEGHGETKPKGRAYRAA